MRLFEIDRPIPAFGVEPVLLCRKGGSAYEFFCFWPYDMPGLCCQRWQDGISQGRGAGEVMGKLAWRGALLALFLAVSMGLAVGMGSVSIPPDTIMREIGAFALGEPMDASASMIVFDIRAPRIIFAAIGGALLALTGLLMQTVSQNYLADPYILGVSSGASTGAVLCLVTGAAQMFAPYGVYVGAFMGAAVATAIVVRLAGSSGSPVKLVLMGMGISALFSAFTMLAIYGAKDEAQVRSAMFWLMGSLTGIQWSMVPVGGAMLFLTMLFIWLMRHELDLILLGRNEARHLGMPVQRVQQMIVLISSLAVAVVVALSGIIGFVGLVVPHIARSLGDSRHAVMLWFTALVGALVMVWADAAARTLFRPEELPIGILTASLGAPVFMWIISRKYKDY